MRILIADDDRASTMMLKGALERWGFEVIAAADGASAWERITGVDPPALAILDWMMPGLSGIELCRRIRSAPLPAPVYVILLTSRTGRQDLVAGLEAGADDYLTKPFDPDELRARIHVGQRTLELMANIKRLSGL
ncbi:MAG TPA: response regulator transcription factor, partial [Candidatus Binatia bacterium]|nr:response regulator transcription factor [Candidatus Binatia bacterium]